MRGQGSVRRSRAKIPFYQLVPGLPRRPRSGWPFDRFRFLSGPARGNAPPGVRPETQRPEPTARRATRRPPPNGEAPRPATGSEPLATRRSWSILNRIGGTTRLNRRGCWSRCGPCQLTQVDRSRDRVDHLGRPASPRSAESPGTAPVRVGSTGDSAGGGVQVRPGSTRISSGRISRSSSEIPASSVSAYRDEGDSVGAESVTSASEPDSNSSGSGTMRSAPHLGQATTVPTFACATPRGVGYTDSNET